MFQATTSSVLLIFNLFISLSQCFPGRIITDPNAIRNEYDFIVIGSGPSGLVVATRLTENPRVSVLVLESGEYVTGEREFYNISLPTKYPTGPRSAPPLEFFWRTPTTSIENLNGRSTIISTAKIVQFRVIILSHLARSQRVFRLTTTTTTYTFFNTMNFSTLTPIRTRLSLLSLYQRGYIMGLI